MERVMGAGGGQANKIKPVKSALCVRASWLWAR